ncbi:MAG: chemotaxis protein CheA [Clostridia bacterium]|nr:chemotaxis protein CheA [Clostridia bacterium]MDD4664980.1 chemotaxis protein CheA [Clostridia bacterium]
MDVSKYLDLFLEEAMEHLQTLNTGLLNLESNPNQLNLLNEIFRSAHTLKGMSATMGYDSITQLTHKMESLLGKIQERKLLLNQEIINTLFQCVDLLENMLTKIREGETPNVDLKGLLDKLTVLEDGQVVTELKTKSDLEKNVKRKNSQEQQQETLEIQFNEYENSVIHEAILKGFNVWKITISLSPDCLMKGVRAFMVFRNLENIGEIIKSVPSVQDIEDEKFDHEFILFLISKQEQKEIEAALSISEIAVKNMDKVKSKKTRANLPQDDVKMNNKTTFVSGNKHKVHQTVRVDIGRLDKLMNLVGELVINKTRLEQICLANDVPGLNEIIEQINRITADLQMVVQNVRMVSIEQVFNRFPRMVRDLTQELGKNVELILEGKDTELDRTVIDEIGDPLVHLIRNALAHGLESPEERKAVHKNTMGILKLSARHEGNRIIICVEDDGRGLDLEAIKKKALENNLVSAAQLEMMDEQAIINLIFESGFSTAKVVTDVSGRGVGLDVVKSKIHALSGQVFVETKKGQGSRFLIKLPLTLAIIQALLVKVQEEVFAIPLANIDETTSLETNQIKNIQGQLAMLLRGRVLPLVYIQNILEVPGDKQAAELNVVVVQKGEQKIGLIVEELIGQQEIVISSLGKLLSGLPGIAGASILGDGKVSLILDIRTLF